MSAEPKFSVTIESTSLNEVFLAAASAHEEETGPYHDAEKCQLCEALARVAEELEMGRLEAIGEEPP